MDCGVRSVISILIFIVIAGNNEKPIRSLFQFMIIRGGEILLLVYVIKIMINQKDT